MSLVALDSLAAWTDAIAALPAEGPLPARTVLVPSERHAHALRRALASEGRGALLAGTRFVGTLTAAAEALAAAGVAFSPGEEALRPARLLALFREGLPLEHFELELLRTTRGWDEAFSDAVAVLEGAGLAPADLPRDVAAARDLAAVWARLAADAGPSWSAARVEGEAAALLERDARAWPFPGATLAAATGHERGAEARFLRAIPRVTLGVRRTRPAPPRHLARVERLFGAEARRLAGGETVRPSPPRTERDLLAAYLFERPEVVADAARPRSAGPDGTVHLEEHAGVEAELEAAAAWVARKVLEDRLPLEEIAVLVPGQGPLAQLVAERLERLPFDGGTLPVHVAGGLPATCTAAGARILAVLRALSAHLSAETLAAVLPSLRLAPPAAPAPASEGGEPAPPPRRHLGHGQATGIAYSLGTVGGNAAWPEGALAWSERAAARLPELERALARARRAGDSGARDAWRLERALEDLRAIRPALDALVGVARVVVGGAPLAATAEALHAFLDRWLLAPAEGGGLAARLAESLAPACAGPLGGRLSGADALEVVERHLAALRVAKGRFGEPAVYVGTVAGAAGLERAAVRVVGLCEGALPSAPSENPVLPERLRARLEDAVPGRVLPGAEDRVAAQLHALLAAVQGARASVALSAPRVDLARTEREPAALFVDAAAALGRPAAGGAAASFAQDGAALRRDAFEPARADAAAHRAANPVGEAAWLDRVARVAADLPRAWTGDAALDLARVEALRAPAGPFGPADGVVGPGGGPFPAVPGTTPERPISATALQQLVQCPRMFLLRRVLRWEAPAAPPSLRELDPAAFGTLVHHALEELYRAHGAEIVARARTLERWQALAVEIGDRHLEALLSEVPLVGGGIRSTERKRLRASLRAFVEYDWSGSGPGRRFVDVERAFGVPAALALEAGGEVLHVRGYVDRLDVERGATLVRDVKSGRPHPRRDGEAPEPYRDVQLGLYQLVARRLAGEWGTPAKVVAAYAYASGRGEVEERAWLRGADAASLAAATEGWLAAAARLLRERAFAPTPAEEDCRLCPFRPLCGSDAARRARTALADVADGEPLAAFRAMKLGEDDE